MQGSGRWTNGEDRPGQSGLTNEANRPRHGWLVEPQHTDAGVRLSARLGINQPLRIPYQLRGKMPRERFKCPKCGDWYVIDDPDEQGDSNLCLVCQEGEGDRDEY